MTMPTNIERLEEIASNAGQRAPKVTLDKLAELLAARSGRHWMELRHGYVQRWALQLYEVEGKSEQRAVETLLDIVDIAPASRPGWGAVSAIDSHIATYCADAQDRQAAHARATVGDVIAGLATAFARAKLSGNERGR